MMDHPYLKLMDQADARWAELMSVVPEMRSAPIWELLTHLWRTDLPVRKTDAIQAMGAIRSPHTAAKYIDVAIKSGFVVETHDNLDKRSKKLMLSDIGRARMDRFLDACVGDLLTASDDLAGRQGYRLPIMYLPR